MYSKASANLHNTWETYWAHYHGVTKIGAWSQRQSLNVVFRMLRTFHVSKTAHIIDVGCGEGRTLQAIRAAGYRRAIGIDNAKASLAICRNNGLVIDRDVFLRDGTRTGYKAKSFDVVFSEGILEHFLDPTPMIHEMARISKKYILLIQPNHFNLYGLAIAILGHLARNNVREYTYSKNYFIRAFEGEGYRLQSFDYTPLGEFFVLFFTK